MAVTSEEKRAEVARGVGQRNGRGFWSDAVSKKGSQHTTRAAGLERLLWIIFVSELICFQILERYGWGVLLMTALAGVFAAVSIVQRHGNIGLSIGPFHIFFLLFCCFSLLSASWAWDPSKVFVRSTTLFELLVFTSIFYAHYVLVEDATEKMLRGVMWAGYILGLYAIVTIGLGNIISGVAGGTRLEAEYANINSIGLSCGLAVVISVYYAMHEGPKLNLILTLPCLLMVAASGSRKALLVVALGLAIVFITGLAKKKFSNGLFFVVMVGLILACLLGFAQNIGLFNVSMARMDGLIALLTGTGTVDASAQARDLMIQIGLEQFVENPILGIGLDNSYYLVGTYLHNNYVELLACTGLVGFCFYYSMYAYILYKMLIYKNRWNPMSQLIVLMIVIMLFMDIGAVSYFSKTTYIYLMIGFIHVMELKNNTKEEACIEAKPLQRKVIRRT